MSARTCYFKGDFDYKSPLWRTKVSFSQPLMNIFACGLFCHKGLVHLHTMSGLLHLQLPTYFLNAENKSTTPPSGTSINIYLHFLTTIKLQDLFLENGK